MSTPPPDSPEAETLYYLRPVKPFDMPKMPLLQRLFVICGWVLTFVALFIGVSVFSFAAKIPLPDMPSVDAPRMDRVEAFVARAVAHEAQESYQLWGAVFIVIGVAVGALTAGAALTRGDRNREEHELLKRENAELKKDIAELEKQVDEASESEAETVSMMADLFEARAGSAFGRRPPPFPASPFDDDDDDDDENPFSPPKPKPPYLN